MDFERAAARLASEQQKSRRERRSKPVGLAVSAKARREAEERRRKTAQRIAAQKKERSKLTYGVRYMDRCDARLCVNRSLGGRAASDDAGDGSDAAPRPTSGGGGAQPTWPPRPSLLLRPVSIHGDGDKLSLPPSVLASLAEAGLVGGADGGQQQQPLAFRVGIINSEYKFPSGQAVKDIMEGAPIDEQSGEVVEGDIDGDDDDLTSDLEEAEEKDSSQDTKAYLDELSYKYVSYTHATVVEFTTEEGQVGLPQSIASVLLGDTNVPRKRTVDPAASVFAAAAADAASPNDGDGDGDANMEDAAEKKDVASMTKQLDDDTGEKTPGHLAWGAFDVPDTDVEITLIKLPKGKECTLVPTHEAVRNGFYNLKDVKLVLEQSLIRTRATLSVNDVVHTWHRGMKFDLVVRDVTPADFGAVSCINTDIEVDLATPEGMEETSDETVADEKSGSSDTKDNGSSSSFAQGTGYRLSDGPPNASKPTASAETEAISAQTTVDLPPEPPVDQKENVCTIQIRGDGATGRRRFDVTKTAIKDLFAFASVSCNLNDVEGASFQLVTRFPRRVFSNGDGAANTLAEVGIGQGGQEMFMIERL